MMLNDYLWLCQSMPNRICLGSRLPPTSTRDFIPSSIVGGIRLIKLAVSLLAIVGGIRLIKLAVSLLAIVVGTPLWLEFDFFQFPTQSVASFGLVITSANLGFLVVNVESPEMTGRGFNAVN